MNKTLSLEQKKEYLRSYLNLKRSIPVLEEEICELQQLYDLPEHKQIYRADCHNSPDCEHLKLLNDQIKTLQQKYYNAIQAYTDIASCIETLPDDTECTVLRLKYIHGKTIESIAETMNYSIRQIQNIHKKALEHLELNL